MKIALILILTLALAGAACFTRPGKREFMLHLLDKQYPEGGAWQAAELQRANQFVQGVTFKDRWLWIDVQKDGQTLYTGVFAHWFARGAARPGSEADATELAKVVR